MMQFFMGQSPTQKTKIKRVNVFIGKKKMNDDPIEVDFIKGEFVVRQYMAERYGAKNFTKVKLEIV